jgi:hypothetical protein
MAITHSKFSVSQADQAREARMTARSVGEIVTAIFVASFLTRTVEELMAGRTTIAEAWPRFAAAGVIILAALLLDRLSKFPPKMDRTYQGTSLQCPACGLWSPPDSVRCDCGRKLK